MINFYTIPEYEMWLEATPDSNKWQHKYYKVCTIPVTKYTVDSTNARVSVRAKTRTLGSTSET